jgi:hypothetical protein
MNYLGVELLEQEIALAVGWEGYIRSIGFERGLALAVGWEEDMNRIGVEKRCPPAFDTHGR